MISILQLTATAAALFLVVGVAAKECDRDVYVSVDMDASVFGTRWQIRDKRTEEIELIGDNSKPDPIRDGAALVGPQVTPGQGRFLCSSRCYRFIATNTQENKCPHNIWIDGVLAIRYPETAKEARTCDVDFDFCIDEDSWRTPAPSPFYTDDDEDPFLKFVTLNPSNGQLRECEATCRADNKKCRDRLKCFERSDSSSKEVPGCRGKAKGGEDYCIDARKDSDSLEYIGGSGNDPDYGPYGRCRGDCDSDDDCVGRYLCRDRSSSDNRPIPGCEGRPQRSIDYCYDPYDVRTPRPTPRPTRKPWHTPRPTPRPTRRPTRPKPTPRPTKRPTWRPPVQENCFVEIKLLTDRYPPETSWQVEEIKNNGNKKLVMAGNGFTVQYRWYNSGQKLDPGRYRFTIFDKAQDGLAAGGEFRVMVDNKKVGSGFGDFGASERVDFRCEGSSINRGDDDGNDGDNGWPGNGPTCSFKGQVARNGEWMTGPTHKCKCLGGSWKQCVRINDGGGNKVEDNSPYKCGRDKTTKNCRCCKDECANKYKGNLSRIKDCKKNICRVYYDRSTCKD